MELISPFILVIHIIVCLLITVAVLLQPGKGGDLGSVFGGSTQSIFGASGAVPFLAKFTRFLAVVFMVTSLSLGYMSTKDFKSSVITDDSVQKTMEFQEAPSLFDENIDNQEIPLDSQPQDTDAGNIDNTGDTDTGGTAETIQTDEFKNNKAQSSDVGLPETEKTDDQ